MFKVGQLIVAIRKDRFGEFQKGEVFTVKGVRAAGCECFDAIIDIGKTTNKGLQICTGCNKTQAKNTRIKWFSNRLFAPVDYSFARMLLRNIEKEMDDLETVKIKTTNGNI